MCSSRRVAAGLLSVYLAPGCSTFARVEECPGNFQGEITTIQIADKRSSAKWILGSVLVREKKDSGSLEMSFAVTEKTTIFRRIGGFRVPASFQSLKKGQQVRVKFCGPVQTSYPAKAKAAEIVIVTGKLSS